MNRKKVAATIGLIIIAIIVMFAYFKKKQTVEVLSLKGKLTFGQVIKIDTYNKSSLGVEYKYFIEGKQYVDYKSHPRIGGYLNASLRQRYFPVIYLEADPAESSEILITPYDFELYNRAFPDSLKWVCEFVNCDK